MAPPPHPPRRGPWYPPPGAPVPPPAGPGFRQPVPAYPPYPGPPPATRTNANAIVALVLGIAGLTFCQPLGIVAIFLGRAARQEIARSGGTESGDGLALAGFVLGIVSAVILGLVVVIFGVVLLVAVLTGGSSGAS